jgi:hypothetical protein
MGQQHGYGVLDTGSEQPAVPLMLKSFLAIVDEEIIKICVGRNDRNALYGWRKCHLFADGQR